MGRHFVYERDSIMSIATFRLASDFFCIWFPCNDFIPRHGLRFCLISVSLGGTRCALTADKRCFFFIWIFLFSKVDLKTFGKVYGRHSLL